MFKNISVALYFIVILFMNSCSLFMVSYPVLEYVKIKNISGCSIIIVANKIKYELNNSQEAVIPISMDTEILLECATLEQKYIKITEMELIQMCDYAKKQSGYNIFKDEHYIYSFLYIVEINKRLQVTAANKDE